MCCRRIAAVSVLVVSVAAACAPEERGPGADGATDPASYTTVRGDADVIRLAFPLPGDTIRSPVTIRGEARGSWYFEAAFPVVLVDWDGRIIAEHHAAAQGDWMTAEFVPFEAVLEFGAPEDIGEFSRRGSLILRRDNPSGLPEHDDALEITVFFAPEDVR